MLYSFLCIHFIFLTKLCLAICNEYMIQYCPITITTPQHSVCRVVQSLHTNQLCILNAVAQCMRWIIVSFITVRQSSTINFSITAIADNKYISTNKNRYAHVSGRCINCRTYCFSFVYESCILNLNGTEFH